MKKCNLLAVLLLVIALATGCSQSGNADRLTVVFADAGWDSVKFHDAVAMFIGETAYDLITQEISGTTPVTYNGLIKGDINVYMEVWTDNMAAYDADIASGTIKELGVNFGDNAQGLYVPRYVIVGDPARNIDPAAPGLRTVHDLLEYSSVFTDPEDSKKGRIYGAISGWEIDEILRKKYAAYGLDEYYNYMDPGSDAALAAAISAAYEKGEPIVAYNWEPTWITGKYDLVLLEDTPYDEELYKEGKCACKSTRVTVCVNGEFPALAPEFCEFLSNYETSSAMTSEALSHMQDTGASYLDTAKWFLREHDDLLDLWLPEEKSVLIREALAV